MLAHEVVHEIVTEIEPRRHGNRRSKTLQPSSLYCRSSLNTHIILSVGLCDEGDELVICANISHAIPEDFRTVTESSSY